MGAVSFTNAVQGIAGSSRIVEVDVTFSASYATGGDSIDLTQIGLRQVDDMHILGYVSKSPSAAGNSGKVTSVGIQPMLAGTPQAPLLKSFVNGSQTSAATNLSALGVVRIEFRGH